MSRKQPAPPPPAPPRKLGPLHEGWPLIDRLLALETAVRDLLSDREVDRAAEEDLRKRVTELERCLRAQKP